MLSKRISRTVTNVIKRTPLISTNELECIINQPQENLRIVNSTITRPFEDVDNDHYYSKGRIPNSTFLDLNEITNYEDKSCHQIPTKAQFKLFMKELDIKKSDKVVLYDDLHISGAARSWWVFKMYGIDAYILDGGFKKWLNDGGEIEENLPFYQRRSHKKDDFDFDERKEENIYQFDDINALSLLIREKEIDFELVDARASPRFNSEVPEPREGMRSGNIKGSKNLPFNTLLNEDKTMRSSSELKKEFEQQNIDLNKEIVTTCGSGVTACVLQLALELMGQGSGERRIYDGSWAEYALRDEVEDHEIFKSLDQVKRAKNL